MSMLELSTLVFSVDTKQLDTAILKTKELSAAQKELGKPIRQPLGGGGSGGANGTSKTLDLGKKLKDLYGDLSDGATRWEASQLRAARQAGISTEEIKKSLNDIKSLSPLTSFDSSIGAVRKVKIELENLQNRVELTKQGIVATRTELEAFGRIPFQVAGQMQSRGGKPIGENGSPGRDAEEYNMQVIARQNEFIEGAKKLSVLRIAEREHIDTVKQTASAQKFLATEMQRVDAVLAQMNSTYGINVGTQEKSARMVADYAVKLQRSGMAAKDAAKELEIYKQKVNEIAKVDQKRAGERLSSALAPQISDVAVSLAGGMPLHLVMMQQGLQIRDLIGQSRIDVKELESVFRDSMKKMVTSIGGTVAALGSMAYGGLKDAGAAVVGFGSKVTGVSFVMDALSSKFPKAAAGMGAFSGVLGAVVGGVLAAGVVAIGALVYEYVKLIGANDDLARSLAVTGGVFGVSLNSSSAYVESLTKMGASTRDAISIIGQMADSGKFTASQIDLVGKAAVDMERYGGVAIKDTIKAFEDMAKDPVKALTELAIKTGDVSPKTLQLAYDLQEQGKMADASRVAVGALAEQHGKAVNKMREDLHPLTVMWVELKRVVSDAWTFIGNTINKGLGVGSELQKTKDAIENIKSIQDGTGGLLTKFAPKDYMKGELLSLQKKIVMLDKVAQVESDARVSASEKSSQIKKNEENELSLMGKKEKARRELLKLEDAYKLSNELARGGQGFGKISNESYLEKKKELEDQLVDKGARAESNKQKSYELSIQEKLNDAYNKMVGNVRELNALEKAILDVRDDKRYKEGTPKLRAEIEKEIEAKRKLIKVITDENSFKVQQAQIDKDAYDIRKQYSDGIAELYQELTVHGEKYEKQLVAINLANMAGLITSDEELKRLKALNLARNSNAEKYFNKKKEDGKKTDQDLSFSEEDSRLKIAELSGTDRVNQLARSEFEVRKQLVKEYSDFYLKETEILKNTEGQQQQDLLDANIARYERKKDLILAEGELKKTMLSEEHERQKNFDSVVKKGYESMGDALADFALTGKSNFGDMVKQMLIDLAKLEIRMQMMKLYDGSGGGGGIIKAISGIFGFANGAAFDKGVQKFAKGGSFTNSVVSRPTMFNMGQMGEAGPEAIVPLKRGRDGALGVASAGGGSNVQVVINNNSGQQVEKKETTDSRGNRRVEITVGEMTAGEVQRSGSSVQRGISQTFGMKPALLTR